MIAWVYLTLSMMACSNVIALAVMAGNRASGLSRCTRGIAIAEVAALIASCMSASWLLLRAHVVMP